MEHKIIQVIRLLTVSISSYHHSHHSHAQRDILKRFTTHSSHIGYSTKLQTFHLPRNKRERPGPTPRCARRLSQSQRWINLLLLRAILDFHNYAHTEIEKVIWCTSVCLLGLGARTLRGRFAWKLPGHRTVGGYYRADAVRLPTRADITICRDTRRSVCLRSISGGGGGVTAEPPGRRRRRRPPQSGWWVTGVSAAPARQGLGDGRDSVMTGRTRRHRSRGLPDTVGDRKLGNCGGW